MFYQTVMGTFLPRRPARAPRRAVCLIKGRRCGVALLLEPIPYSCLIAVVACASRSRATS